MSVVPLIEMVCHKMSMMHGQKARRKQGNIEDTWPMDFNVARGTSFQWGPANQSVSGSKKITTSGPQAH
jgi:hypothetical protein